VIALLGCVSMKGIVPALARDLYVSPLWKLRRAYAERFSDRWFVLSAKHGLVLPDTVIAPYDLALTDLGWKQRNFWAQQIVWDLREHGVTGATEQVEIHAGVAYRKGVQETLGAVCPVSGLGIGQQFVWYKQRLEAGVDESTKVEERATQ
jgi:hypothetical protein